MKHFFKLVGICVIGFAYFLLCACQDSNKNKSAPEKIITVQATSTQNTLYFAGQIKPLKTTPVISPVDGVITKRFFIFGERLTKGKPLCTISSSKQLVDYRNALTDYLKAKQTLNNDKSKFTNAKKLYELGVKSRNDFIEAQNTYHLSELTFSQADAKLKNTMKYHKIDNLEGLTLNDIDTVTKVLKLNQNAQTITLDAPQSGIALFPKDDDASSTSAQVKAGDILVNIADTQGLSLNIHISQSNINQIREKQPVQITSDAFGSLILNGYIDNITEMATRYNNAPAFTAQIIVPKLTPEEQRVVRIGMNAKVAITLKLPKQIMVPINAVTEDNGLEFVTKINAQTKKREKTLVTTGQTTSDSIVIHFGLKKGDQIVVPNHT